MNARYLIIYIDFFMRDEENSNGKFFFLKEQNKF
jgi:hypothetical protein